MAQLVLTSDTLAGTPATGTLEYNGQFFGTDSAAARAQMQRITLGTAVASTSGTSIDFTSIPAWVKRITVMFSGVSTNGAADIYIQIGSGSVTTTGYIAQRVYILSNSSYSAVSTTTSAISWIWTNNSSDIRYGHVVLTNVSGNVWISSANVGTMNSVAAWSTGGITLGGVLDRVRLTTSNGTDTFDAGSINILYEG